MCFGPGSNLLKCLRKRGYVGKIIEAGGMQDFKARSVQLPISIRIGAGITTGSRDDRASDRCGKQSPGWIGVDVQFQLPHLQVLQLLWQGAMRVLNCFQQRRPGRTDQVSDGRMRSKVIGIVSSDQLQFVQTDVVGVARRLLSFADRRVEQRDQQQNQPWGPWTHG